MDTQNTPVHIKLWHRDFWMMAVANLLLMMCNYMLIPAMPPYLIHHGLSALQVGEIMGVYGLGVFALGTFCSYLVQRYRRNHVCQFAVLGTALCIAVLYYLDFVLNVKLEFWMILLSRFMMGAFLGLAQMTLSSTLIIDTCESFQRTEANYTAAWFSRFALSLGPLTSILVYHWFNAQTVFIVACILPVISCILISLVKFPFKAPSDNMSLFSLDRFFLPQGFWLFLNLLMIMTAVGMLLSIQVSETFFEMLMVGFVVAILAEKYVFPDADLKSEVLTGLILMGAAVLICYTHQVSAITTIVPSLIGFAIGVIGSRFLLFYLKLAKHCQRGTSQSSFFLSWELGLSIGLFLGYIYPDMILTISCTLVVVSLIFYNFFVHGWYMKNKNR